MPSQLIRYPWPLGGLVEGEAYENQPEGTTTDALNVRSYDVYKRRNRGGQRSGIEKVYADRVNGDVPIQRIKSTARALDPDGVVVDQTIADIDFSTYPAGRLDTQSAEWTGYDASFTAGATGSNHLEVASGVVRDVGAGAVGGTDIDLAVHEDSPTGDKFILTADIVFWQVVNKESGVFFRGDPAGQDYVAVTLGSDGSNNDRLRVLTLTGGSFGFTNLSLSQGFTNGTTYTLKLVLNGNNMEVWVDSTLEDTATVTAHSGNTRVGILSNVRSDGFGIASYKLESGAAPTSLRETRLVYVSGGTVKEANTTSTTLNTPTNGSGAMATSGRVDMVGAFGDMYLVDGLSANYQYLDFSANEVKDWATDVTAGSLPAGSVDTTQGCRIITLYRGRVVMAGLREEPQNWFMSKSGDPFDWDYSPATTSAIQAVAGNNSNVGELGDVVTCLAPFLDDIMIMGGADTLWVMRGDPAAGGEIDNISRQIGIVGPEAYTWDTAGNLYFVARNGFYRLANGSNQPELLSRGRLDKRFADLDVRTDRVTLVYDPKWQGVHIFVSPLNSPTAAKIHYWWDERNNAFWPDQYPVGIGPSTVLSYNDDTDGPTVLIGGYDGYIRKFSDTAFTDDGTIISSRVRLTPTQPGDIFAAHMLDDLTFVMADDGDPVTLKVFSGDTAEQAEANLSTDTPRLRRTLQSRRNNAIRQRIAANTTIVQLSQSGLDGSGAGWAYEAGGARVRIMNRLHGRKVT